MVARLGRVRERVRLFGKYTCRRDTKPCRTGASILWLARSETPLVLEFFGLVEQKAIKPRLFFEHSVCLGRGTACSTRPRRPEIWPWVGIPSC